MMDHELRSCFSPWDLPMDFETMTQEKVDPRPEKGLEDSLFVNTVLGHIFDLLKFLVVRTFAAVSVIGL